MTATKDPMSADVVVRVSEIDLAAHRATIEQLAVQAVAKMLAERFLDEHKAEIFEMLQQREVAEEVADRLLGKKKGAAQEQENHFASLLQQYGQLQQAKTGASVGTQFTPQYLPSGTGMLASAQVGTLASWLNGETK